MIDLSVLLAGVRLKNPIVVASGTFGFGREYSEFWDLDRLGAVSTKGLTLNPREGNKPPRIAETPMGMLNSIGLQNPGVHAFLEQEFPFLKEKGATVIVNIGGESVEEYSRLASVLGDKPDLLEVNISCPNMEKGCLSFGSDPDSAYEVTKAVKQESGCPVLIKLTPNVTNIGTLSQAVEAAGADGLTLINTVTGLRIDPKTRKPILHRGTGGLSGPAILPIALRCVREVNDVSSLPILGMGGVHSGETAVEMMLAGASAVGVGTALFQDPFAPIRILAQLEAFAQNENISKIADLTGAMRPWE